MHCLPPSDLKWPGRNNTPHHRHIQSTIHRQAGLCTAWSYRLGFQSIAWDMREREGEWEGGWSCSESKWEEIWVNPSLFSSPYWPLSVWPRRGSELQGGRVNQMIITPIFILRPCAFSCPTDSQWRNEPQSIVWGAPVFLLHFLQSQWHFPVYSSDCAL